MGLNNEGTWLCRSYSCLGSRCVHPFHLRRLRRTPSRPRRRLHRPTLLKEQLQLLVSWKQQARHMTITVVYAPFTYLFASVHFCHFNCFYHKKSRHSWSGDSRDRHGQVISRWQHRQVLLIVGEHRPTVSINDRHFRVVLIIECISRHSI